MEVTFDRVTQNISDDTVLHDISLTVPTGEVVAIIGPSGAGKTTLLRLAALFDTPTTGQITFDGDDPWLESDRDRLKLRRQFGMVFQESRLFDTTVRRNVEYGIRVRQSWRDRIGSRLRPAFGDSDDPNRSKRALSMVGMEGQIDRTVGSLSTGERQRVAFARALAIDPAILLLDEPTSNLDPRNTAIIEAALERAKRRDLSVLLATHDMHQARRIADRIGVLIEGQLVEFGPPSRIFSEPNDSRTEAFVNGDLLFEAEATEVVFG